MLSMQRSAIAEENSMNFKKIISTVIISVTVLFALSSCSGLFGGDDASGDTKNPGKSESVKYTTVIYSDAELDLSLVISEMRDIYGPMVALGLDGETPISDGEAVFGDSSRPITAKAKAELERQLSTSTRYDIGYIIYAEGGSVAVYWMEPEMAAIAIQKFIDVCIADKRLVLSAGDVAHEYYSKREYDNNKYWMALEAVASDETLAALKRLNNYFDGNKLISWMGNLYDPDIGGFYYSRDARDYSGFLPDLESTVFVITTVYKSKGIESYDDLPESIRAKILEFVWSTQSANDGYFYHPQWPQDKSQLQTDRYGRDIGWATSLINYLNLDTDGDGVLEDQYPKYCAPNGTKCALHHGTDNTCSFPVSTASYASLIDGEVTTTVTSGVSAAVSKVAKSSVSLTASVSQHPDYSSATAFKAWLEAYNASIKEDSGKAHNLAAIRGEITAKGYASIVYEHLYNTQREVLEEQLADGEEPTGLWQKTVDYKAVWGLLKYAGFYTNGAQGGPFYEDCILYAVKTCIKVILMAPDDAKYYMNDVYNMWTGISNLVSIVRSMNKNTEALADIYELVRENAAELIDSTMARMDGFKQEDGSFSYNSDGTTQPKIYGTVVCFGNKEGDTNAVHLCNDMYISIFHSLNYTMVPLFTKDDGQTFIDILLESESINKEKVEATTLDYESQSYKTSIFYRLSSTGAQVVDCEDPEDSSNSVLKFTTGAGAGDYLYFNASGMGTSCYLFETDMYVSKDAASMQLYQMKLGELFMLEFTKNGNTITIEADQDKYSAKGEDLLGSFSAGEWVTIRVECYPAGEDTDFDEPQLKIWIDDVLTAVSSNYIGKGTTDPVYATFSQVEFYTLLKAEGTAYFDNTFVSREAKEFDEYDEEISDSRGEV